MNQHPDNGGDLKGAKDRMVRCDKCRSLGPVFELATGDCWGGEGCALGRAGAHPAEKVLAQATLLIQDAMRILKGQRV